MSPMLVGLYWGCIRRWKAGIDYHLSIHDDLSIVHYEHPLLIDRRRTESSSPVQRQRLGDTVSVEFEQSWLSAAIQ